uniref:Uncharacterized protein n=1 Tax=Anguilla anguilla TaxID=7936 RepID=A0A0E9Q759_ANGAN
MYTQSCSYIKIVARLTVKSHLKMKHSRKQRIVCGQRQIKK